MAQTHSPGEIPLRYLPRSSRASILSALSVVVGGAAFVFSLLRDPQLAWRAYVVNWLYFTSLATGALALYAVWVVTKARWCWPVRRIALAFVAFLPFSFLLLLPMVGLRENYFPWIEAMAHDPVVQRKAAYLNIPFLLSRNLVGLLLLFGLFLYMAYRSLRPDLGLAKDVGRRELEGWRRQWAERLTQNWGGQEHEEAFSNRRLNTLAPAAVILFAVVMSVVAFDWAMTLEPHWFSTLFGGWFFMGAFWGGVAATAWATVYVKGQDPDLGKLIGSQQLHDLGKLAFAFTVFWAYLFWSQYLVIWYGKLPWEQLWVVKRSEDPWAFLSLSAILLCFVIPFAGLLGRKPKMTPWSLRLFVSVILIGLWLERYLMVVPSLHDGHPPITFLEPAIGLMFLGIFLGSVRWFLSSFPIVQVWQPMVEGELLEAEGRGGGEKGVLV